SGHALRELQGKRIGSSALEAGMVPAGPSDAVATLSFLSSALCRLSAPSRTGISDPSHRLAGMKTSVSRGRTAFISVGGHRSKSAPMNSPSNKRASDSYGIGGFLVTGFLQSTSYQGVV